MVYWLYGNLNSKRNRIGSCKTSCKLITLRNSSVSAMDYVTYINTHNILNIYFYLINKHMSIFSIKTYSTKLLSV